MRIRLLVAACVLVLAACGGGSGLAGIGGPPSAQSVAANDSDWPGLHRCPESGSYDSYLQAEKAKAPSHYQSDKSSWDQLKAAGANDSYIAVYADQSSHCGEFGVGTPGGSPGNIVYLYAIRFKDSSSAAANYKVSSSDFHVSAAELSQLKAAGASVKTGSETGLSDNAVELSIAIEGATLFTAFWQNKSFEVVLVTLNESAASSKAAASINGRVH